MNRHPLKLTRLMLFARRAPIDRTPAEVGLEYEDVAFKAGDGVGLKGWFIPSKAESPAPAIVFVHGWMWNRLGNVAGQVPVDDRDVDFLPAARALHDAGFHVLMYDVRKHGESESGGGLVSFGPLEKRDFVGAVAYLRSRPDVDGQRIGSLGVSMGGTIALYGAPECQPIKAILALQPAKVTTFNANFCRLEFGRAGPLVMMPPIELIYRAWRVTPPSKQDPGAPARLARRHGRQVRPGHRRPLRDDGGRRGVRRGHAERRRAGRASSRRTAATTATGTSQSAATRSRTSSLGTFRRRHLRAQERVEGRRPAAACASS